MYEELCAAVGNERFELISNLSRRDIDIIHRYCKDNCKKCPLALHYVDKNGIIRICCVETHTYRMVREVLKEGGHFIKLKGI